MGNLPASIVQGAINDAVVTIHNGTLMGLPSDVHNGTTGVLVQDMEMTNDITGCSLFGCAAEESTVEMFDEQGVHFADFDLPKTDLPQGSVRTQYSTTLTVKDVSSFRNFATNLIFAELPIDGYPQDRFAKISIKSKLHMTAFDGGVKLPIVANLEKSVMCQGMGDGNEMSHAPSGQFAAVAMKCWMEGQPIPAGGRPLPTCEAAKSDTGCTNGTVIAKHDAPAKFDDAKEFCCNLCDITAGCTSFTWASAKCSLMSSCTVGDVSGSYHAGRVMDDCDAKLGKEFSSSNIVNTTVVQAPYVESCCKACKGNRDCVGASVDPVKGTCVMAGLPVDTSDDDRYIMLTPTFVGTSTIVL